MVSGAPIITGITVIIIIIIIIIIITTARNKGVLTPTGLNRH
jgi:hypothetical protein